MYSYICVYIYIYIYIYLYIYIYNKIHEDYSLRFFCTHQWGRRESFILSPRALKRSEMQHATHRI